VGPMGSVVTFIPALYGRIVSQTSPVRSAITSLVAVPDGSSRASGYEPDLPDARPAMKPSAAVKTESAIARAVFCTSALWLWK
jgi:hypothetical protein